MQPPQTYSWIALTASAPVILLLTTWTLAVFHCRRRQWSTTDIFLVSILSQSVVQQFLGFMYSTLVLLKLSSIPTGDAVCTGMMWFFITIPIFKGTTITSLAVDRWLFFSKFNYRLSVRKNHIRYHIAVLAILSCTVGFTALITFNNPDLLTTTTTDHSFGSSQYSFDQCTFLPFKFDLKFVIFYISMHLIIVLVGMIALCKSVSHSRSFNNNANDNNNDSNQHASSRKANCKRRRRRNIPIDLTPTLSNTSTASSSISNGSPSAFFSTPGLTAKAVLSNSSSSSPPNNNHHATYQPRNKLLLDFQDQNKKDEKKYSRLSTSVGLLVLTILCTHLPFTVATLLARFEVLAPAPFGIKDDQLSILNWPVTNVILWLQLLEGLSILLILLIVDNIVPGWIFNRRCSKKKMVKAANLPSMSFNTILHHESNNKGFKHGMTGGEPGASQLNNKAILPNYHTNAAYIPEHTYKGTRFPITNGSLFAGLNAVTPSSVRPDNSQRDFVTVHDQFHRILEDSSNNHRLSKHDLTGFGQFTQAFPEDDSEYDKKSYHQRYASVASCTTVANEDFEFHHSRPFYQRTPLEFNPSTYVVPKSQNLTITKSKPSDYNSTQRASMKLMVQKSAATETKVRPPMMSHYDTVVSSHHGRENPAPTSLSMNDLDLIDEMEFQYSPTSVSASIKPKLSGTGMPEYKQKRMYRKRARIPPTNAFKDNSGRKAYKTPDQSKSISNRRVLSMECLSPQTQQTDNKNYFDISYLDTGDILVRKADSSKCIFVTDFI